MTQTIKSPNSMARTVKILAGRIVTVDPTSGVLKKPFPCAQTIEVSCTSGRILSITPTMQSDIHELTSNADIIDLRSNTVLPGFIDAHVHCEFLPTKGLPDPGIQNS